MFLEGSCHDPGRAIGKISAPLYDNTRELCVSHRHEELRKQKKPRIDFWQFRGVHSQRYCANSKLQTDFFFLLVKKNKTCADIFNLTSTETISCKEVFNLLRGHNIQQRY